MLEYSVAALLLSGCAENPREIITLEIVMEIDGNSISEEYFTPGNILFDNEDNLYILDPVSMKILVYDSNGNYLFDFGRPGEGPEEFNQMGFCFDMDSNNILYIGDGPASIKIFNSDGGYLNTVSPDVECIVDLAAGADNKIFISSVAIADWSDYYPIARISREGEIERRFGRIGIETDQMPHWEKYAVSSCVIDVDEEGFVYYTSIVDYQIFKYDKDGNLVFTVEGDTPFEASYEEQPPYGNRTLTPVVLDICVDQSMIYVLWGQGSEENNYQRVDVFEKYHGELLGYFFVPVPCHDRIIFIKAVDGEYLYTASLSDAIIRKYAMHHCENAW